MGALGPVFRTYEPTRDRLVAVKVFRLDITPEQAQSLADELSVAAEAGLFHPSVVEPIAAGVEGTVAYRAEEYVAAESLDVALRHYAPAAMSRVLPFITQLAGAIDFARTSGVGHGALHPRDIFVTPEEARATGFGVVEALERVGLRAPVRRPYSAPERVAGAPWSTPADVFSLAAIAYELLTGRRPAGTGGQIGSLNGTGVGRDSADLVHAVLARAMHEVAEERYGSALEFAAALDAASNGKAPVVTPAAPRVSAPVAPTVAPIKDQDVADEADVAAVDAEQDDEDITAEREADEDLPAYRALPVAADRSERTLFDDENEEAVEDLALDAPVPSDTDRFADEFAVAAREPEAFPSEAAFRVPEMDESPKRRQPDPDTFADRMPVAPAIAPIDREPPVISAYRDDVVTPDRSGPSWMAVAMMVILALLVGFAAGWMVGPAAPPQVASANPDPVPSTVSQSAPTPTTGAPPAAEPSAPASAAAAAPSTTPPSASPAPESTPPPASSARVPPVTTPAESRPAPRTGTLTVRSTPSGANVTVDGKWVGRTPLTLDKMAFGTHRVRVVEQGYAVSMQDVSLNGSTTSRDLSVRLQRTASATAPAPRTEKPATTQKPAAATQKAGYTGTVYVDSLPRGAQVFLNGRAVGNTPVLIPDVPVGSQIVRLELPDHRTWSTSTRVVAGQQVKVSGSLERIR